MGRRLIVAGLALLGLSAASKVSCDFNLEFVDTSAVSASFYFNKVGTEFIELEQGDLATGPDTEIDELEALWQATGGKAQDEVKNAIKAHKAPQGTPAVVKKTGVGFCKELLINATDKEQNAVLCMLADEVIYAEDRKKADNTSQRVGFFWTAKPEAADHVAYGKTLVEMMQQARNGKGPSYWIPELKDNTDTAFFSNELLKALNDKAEYGKSVVVGATHQAANFENLSNLTKREIIASGEIKPIANQGGGGGDNGDNTKPKPKPNNGNTTGNGDGDGNDGQTRVVKGGQQTDSGSGDGDGNGNGKGPTAKVDGKGDGKAVDTTTSVQPKEIKDVTKKLVNEGADKTTKDDNTDSLVAVAKFRHTGSLQKSTETKGASSVRRRLAKNAEKENETELAKLLKEYVQKYKDVRFMAGKSGLVVYVQPEAVILSKSREEVVRILKEHTTSIAVIVQTENPKFVLTEATVTRITDVKEDTLTKSNALGFGKGAGYAWLVGAIAVLASLAV